MYAIGRDERINARLLASLIAIAILVLSAGCGRRGKDDSVDVQASALIPSIDALRSLPYLNYSPKEADERNGVVVLDVDRSYPGYNLHSNSTLCLAELIDRRGRVVRSWEYKPCHRWSNCELLPNGDLLVAGVDVTSEERSKSEFLQSRYLLRFSFEGDAIWKRRLPAHHDIELTPRNQLLTLTMSYRRIPEVSTEIDVRDSLLTLLSLDGEMIGEVSLYDSFTAESSKHSLKRVRIKEKNGHVEFDMFHANSIEWMRRPGLERKHPLYAESNILFSLRHQNAIGVLDWDRKRLVWTWGPGEISGPHDATVLDNGNILLFDNGLARRWSRVIELDPVTEEIIWEYKAPNPKDFFTASRGGSQRLPNGNTLITNSDHGQVFEVAGDGEIVWEFLNPHLNDERRRATIFKTTRYELSFIDELLERPASD